MRNEKQILQDIRQKVISQSKLIFGTQTCLSEQDTEVTEDFDLLVSFEQALQRDVDRAEGSPDGGVVHQLGHRLPLFVFGGSSSWSLEIKFFCQPAF